MTPDVSQMEYNKQKIYKNYIPCYHMVFCLLNLREVAYLEEVM
jgi:hypothetical protein